MRALLIGNVYTPHEEDGVTNDTQIFLAAIDDERICGASRASWEGARFDELFASMIRAQLIPIGSLALCRSLPHVLTRALTLQAFSFTIWP